MQELPRINRTYILNLRSGGITIRQGLPKAKRFGRLKRVEKSRLVLEPRIRNTQTQVKHWILEQYLRTWSSILIQGWKNRRRGPFHATLQYIDGFAYAGRYSGDAQDILLQKDPSPVWGSPIIGIRCLMNAKEMATKLGLPVDIKTILVERNRNIYRELRNSLIKAECGSRVIATDSVQNVKDGQILAIHGDFVHIYKDILHTFGGRFTKSFFLLDPWGPKGIPFNSVIDIISRSGVDVMIYVPVLELVKKKGLLQKENLSDRETKLLSGYDDMFGTPLWRDISINYSGEELEEKLMELYQQQLVNSDPNVVVKKTRLLFPEKNRTIYYLFLTTHDPTGALRLNEILYRASVTEQKLRTEFRTAFQVSRALERGQLTLFSNPDFFNAVNLVSSKENREINEQALSEHIIDYLSSGPKIIREIYRSLADSDLFIDDIRKALNTLRRNGRVAFERIRNDEKVYLVN